MILNKLLLSGCRCSTHMHFYHKIGDYLLKSENQLVLCLNSMFKYNKCRRIFNSKNTQIKLSFQLAVISEPRHWRCKILIDYSLFSDHWKLSYCFFVVVVCFRNWVFLQNVDCFFLITLLYKSLLLAKRIILLFLATILRFMLIHENIRLSLGCRCFYYNSYNGLYVHVSVGRKISWTRFPGAQTSRSLATFSAFCYFYFLLPFAYLTPLLITFYGV